MACNSTLITNKTQNYYHYFIRTRENAENSKKGRILNYIFLALISQRSVGCSSAATDPYTFQGPNIVLTCALRTFFIGYLFKILYTVGGYLHQLSVGSVIIHA